MTTDSSDFVIKHKEATVSALLPRHHYFKNVSANILQLIARHASLKPTMRFLHTSLPSTSPFIHDGNLLNPAPIPLATGPRRELPHPKAAQPLYYVSPPLPQTIIHISTDDVLQLPKILLPHQKSKLDSRIANITELMEDEMTALETEKENIKKTSRANKARIEELTERLTELRKQVKPDSGGREPTRERNRERDRDDFGRIPRDVDEKMDEDKEAEVEKNEGDDREKGVQIKGDDGDIEVEY